LGVADAGDLQLAHEALARHWPRLRDWLGEDQTGQRILRHLSSEAREWEAQGQSDGTLYRGVRLQGALAWVAEHEDDTTALEREFLDASSAAAERELLAAQQLTEQTQVLLDGQRKRNRQLRLTLGVAAVLLVASVVGAAVARFQANEAERADAAARAARDVSEALRIGTLAESADEPSVAFALAAEALTIDDSEASRVHALEVFGNFPSLLAAAANPPGFAPDGTLGWEDGTLAAHTVDGTVLLDPQTLAVRGYAQEPEVPADVDNAETLLGVSPDGARAFVLGEEGSRVDVIDAASGRVVASRRLQNRLPKSKGTVALSPDGAVLAIAESHAALFLDSALDPIGSTSEISTTPTGLAFDPAGRLLAAGLSEEGFADTGTSIVWNVATGSEVHRAKSGSGAVWSHVFAPDSTSVYSAGADGIRRWDLSASRAIVRTPAGDPTTFRADDTVLSLWDDSVEAWIAEACRLAGRPLTDTEWREFVGDHPYRPVCDS
jgi:hypothetical protein